MDYPQYQEQISDDELASIEQSEAMNNESLGMGFPKPPTRDTVFKFFKHLLSLKDSSKIGNLQKLELGNPKISVRGYKSIALYATLEGLDDVSKYLQDESEITLATSLSKQGFLSQLFVTQIKKEQKVQPTKEKTGWFSKNVENK